MTLTRCTVLLWLAVGAIAGCGPAEQPLSPAGATPQGATMSHSEHHSPEPAAGLTPSPNAAAVPTDTELYQQIRQLTANPQADTLAQCRLVPLGHKPCGGPASYLVYSVKNLDEQDLLQKIEQYSRLSQARQQAAGLVSDCAIVPEPVLAIRDGLCVAVPAGLAEQ